MAGSDLPSAGGDFLTEVPPGAGAYLLSRVLHDWDDDVAQRILRVCRAAMRPDSVLLVVVIGVALAGFVIGDLFTSGRTFPSIAAISAQNIIAETLQSIVVSGQSPAEAVSAGQARMEEASR